MAGYGTVTHRNPNVPGASFYRYGLDPVEITFTNMTFTQTQTTGILSNTLTMQMTTGAPGGGVLDVLVGVDPGLTTISSQSPYSSPRAEVLSQSYSSASSGTITATIRVTTAPVIASPCYLTFRLGNASMHQFVVSVVYYNPPAISGASAERYNNALGQQDDAGTYLRAIATFSYDAIGGPIPVTSTFAWRIADGSWSVEIPFSSNTWTSVFGGGAISNSLAYQVRFTVTDTVGYKITSTVSLPAIIFARGYAYRRYFDGTAWSPWAIGGW